jgi:hypothetical protein
VAIWVLEDLPEGTQVDSVVMIQPAVDPNRDLSFALRHVRALLFATQSANDWPVLGIGTMLFGTADGGVHSAAAGLCGFKMPGTADAVQYAKLKAVKYAPAWIGYGAFGDHITQMNPAMAQAVLAPMVLADVANEYPTTFPATVEQITK